MSCRVFVQSDPAALQKLVPEWEELAADAIEPYPFYEPWLLLPALRAFPPGPDVRFVFLRRDGRLDALFPLQRVRRYRGLPASAVLTWRHRHCMLCTPLLRSRWAAESLAELIGWLRGEQAARLFELSCVPAGGAFHQAILDATNAQGLVAVTTYGFGRALLRLQGDADGYIASCVPAKQRANLRRNECRLRELGEVSHRVLRAGDDIERWIAEFLALEASGWKGRTGSALACEAANRSFAEQALRGAFERGRLAMVGVDLAGKPIARYAAILAGEGAYAFKTAYDEDLRRFGPGVMALLDITRAVHELPEVQWMDSHTGPSNECVDRLWKDRRIVQRVVIGLGSFGELALASLPLLQWAKRRVSR